MTGVANAPYVNRLWESVTDGEAHNRTRMWPTGLWPNYDPIGAKLDNDTEKMQLACQLLTQRCVEILAKPKAKEFIGAPCAGWPVWPTASEAASWCEAGDTKVEPQQEVRQEDINELLAHLAPKADAVTLPSQAPPGLETTWRRRTLVELKGPWKSPREVERPSGAMPRIGAAVTVSNRFQRLADERKQKFPRRIGRKKKAKAIFSQVLRFPCFRLS